MANLTPTAGYFWQDIHEKLTDKLSAIQKEGLGIIQRSEQSISAAKEALQELQLGLQNYVFSDIEEEIHFYKRINPGFYSILLVNSTIYKIELGMPPGSKSDQEAYLKREQEKIKLFFNENRFIYQYLRSGQTYLDDRLFCRSAQQTVYPLAFSNSLDDVACASFDYLVGRIMANDELQTYFNKSLDDLNKSEGTRAINQAALVWTESKTALIELAYAIQAIGAVNSGKADLKEIIDGLQNLFNVSLGNYPRTFQEILARKTGYTNFLDKLRDKLLLRIQAIEEKYIK